MLKLKVIVKGPYNDHNHRCRKQPYEVGEELLTETVYGQSLIASGYCERWVDEPTRDDPDTPPAEGEIATRTTLPWKGTLDKLKNLVRHDDDPQPPQRRKKKKKSEVSTEEEAVVTYLTEKLGSDKEVEEGVTYLSLDDTPKASARAIELAEEHGIDLHTVKGTGARGRILKGDIQTIVDSREA